jgi:glutathione S-transferase
MINDPVFQLYALCSSVLVVVLYGLGFLTAKTRAERKVVVNHEDTKVNGGASVQDAEHADVQRLKRAHINSLENAVPFFAIGLLYTMTSPSLALARGLFITFAAIRLLHAVFYVSAKQPFRTASFAVGALINLTMVVQVVRAVL